MRFVVPAVSAALVGVLAVSASASVPSPGTAVSAAGVRASAVGTAPPGPAQVNTTTPTGVEAAAPGRVAATPGSVAASPGSVAATPGSVTASPGSDSEAPRAVTVTPGSFGYAWPLSPRPEILRRFEQPVSQWSSGHRGVDLLAPVGQPVLSAGDGVVAFSGVVAGRGVVTVRHRSGLRTTYEPVEHRLAPGVRVQRGDRIGVLSPIPGHCMPVSCLHWGAISAQSYRDPLSLLGFGRPVLLPLG